MTKHDNYRSFSHNKAVMRIMDVLFILVAASGLFFLVKGVLVTAIICFVYCAFNAYKKQWTMTHPAAVIEGESLQFNLKWLSDPQRIALCHIKDISIEDMRYLNMLLTNNETARFDMSRLNESEREDFVNYLKSAVRTNST